MIKGLMWIPIVGLILKYKYLYDIPTSRYWDNYQIYTSVFVFLLAFIYFIGFNINF